MPVLRIVFEEQVFFDTDKSIVRPKSTSVLTAVAETLRSQSGPVALFVAGHANSRGSDAYNLDLSVRRANSVARALNSNGIGSSIIWRVGFGKAIPLKPNTSAQNMAYNRRVEFLIASQPGVIVAWIGSTKTLCEGDAACGGLSAPMKFTAMPVGGEGAKPIPVEVPARPRLGPSGGVKSARPPIPSILPERPSLLEITPHTSE